MADNASVPENPPNGSAKDVVSDPGLPTPAASVGPDEERNKADQRRQEAKSSKATAQNATLVDAGKFEASEQDGAPINAGISASAEQGVAPTSQETTASAGQRAAPTSQETTASAGQRAAPISQETTASAGQKTASISQETTASAGQEVGPTDNAQENSLLLKKKVGAGPIQKGVAEQFNRIGKNGKRASSDKKKLQAIDRVLHCDPANPRDILNIPPSAGKEQTQKAFFKMLVLTNPNRLSNPNQKLVKRATDAHERVKMTSEKFEFPDQSVNEDEAEFDDMKGIVSTDRSELLERIYGEAEDLLADLFKNPGDTGIQAKLDDKNKEIAARNEIDNIKTGERGEALIDVKAIFEFFVRRNALHKELAQSPKDHVMYEGLLGKLAGEFASFIDENGYPVKWANLFKLTEGSGYGVKVKAPNSRGKREVRAGFTWDGEPILACRKFMGGYRYYVQILVNNYETCDVRIADEIGPTASRAYLGWDQCVMVGEDARKYRKKDAEKFGEVLHVACKPTKTQTIPKDPNRQPRRPLTDVYATFDKKAVWMTYSDLVNMLGKFEATKNLEIYYNDRLKQYPWDVPPKRVITVHETPSYRKVANKSLDRPEPTIAPEDRPDQNAQAGKARDDEIAALKLQNADMMKKLSDLTQMLTQLTANAATVSQSAQT